MEHRVVVATAKVRIFKQITTRKLLNADEEKLLLLPQRYEFSSKSQHNNTTAPDEDGCCCYRKGTNFQANHNKQCVVLDYEVVVVATAKVRIFKQITTGRLLNSTSYSCCCYRKGTNFQASHNTLLM